MNNLSNIEISHYKVLALPKNPEPNSVFYLFDPATKVVSGYITDKKGIPVPLFNVQEDGGSDVKSVTGTGVTGTAANPRVNIATFVSNQLGNLVRLSNVDGKLV